ncbi:hypothetical protein Nepgr_024028 [Nepenthes gracilis]|uniref:Uncharacterized protein n=1 Tax=Nepenthes gracilis TaxID=150966 RepID=A0AAD3XZN3_NEPGR|nr:hypothetical protein Nepgr_024028 [Nepenthes gracilis]
MFPTFRVFHVETNTDYSRASLNIRSPHQEVGIPQSESPLVICGLGHDSNCGGQDFPPCEAPHNHHINLADSLLYHRISEIPPAYL